MSGERWADQRRAVRGTADRHGSQLSARRRPLAAGQLNRCWLSRRSPLGSSTAAGWVVARRWAHL